MRWNERIVRMLDHRQQQIAIHPRMEKGKFSTLAEHIAPAKINGIERGVQGMRTIQWLESSRVLGAFASR